MKHTVTNDYTHPELEWVGDDKLIFITAHEMITKEKFGYTVNYPYYSNFKPLFPAARF